MFRLPSEEFLRHNLRKMKKIKLQKFLISFFSMIVSKILRSARRTLEDFFRGQKIMLFSVFSKISLYFFLLSHVRLEELLKSFM